ncbi:MAG: DsrE family protein [Armatimonadetes bacterium]|nr:DsrE family protein [Armatimonadota bacterium]
MENKTSRDLKVLFLFTKRPYDGTDTTWHMLNLAMTYVAYCDNVTIFLMSQGMELALKGINPPVGYTNLRELLLESMRLGASVKICKTCIERCTNCQGDFVSGVEVSDRVDLMNLINVSDKFIQV